MAKPPAASNKVDTDTARRAFSFRFIGEAISELRRVTWPSRQETMRLTIMVIIIAAAVGLFLGVIDLFFSRLLDLLI